MQIKNYSKVLLLVMAVSLFSCEVNPGKMILKKWKIKEVEIQYGEKAKEKMKALKQDEEKTTKEVRESILALEYFEFKEDKTYQSAKGKGTWELKDNGKMINIRATDQNDSKGTDIQIEKLTGTELILFDNSQAEEFGSLRLILE